VNTIHEIVRTENISFRGRRIGYE